MTELDIIEPGAHAHITPTGVTFTNEISIDEWAQLGERLERHDRGLRWVIGDWLVYGSDRFGARAAVIADSLSMATGSVANAASVCRRVSHARRRPELSFSHHEEVAHLADDVQVRMLDTAVCEGLSKSVLRQLVQEEERAHRELRTPVEGQASGMEPVSEMMVSPRAAPAESRVAVETVTFRISGQQIDPGVLADGVALIREGLEAWLHGHGVEATVEVET